MSQNLTTLKEIGALTEDFDPHLPLIFSTDEGDIGPGYHVTELKHLDISSIDCGGRLADWTETQLQLLDGAEGGHMEVGKFIAIARRSIAQVPGLARSTLAVEYAPGNRGLRRYLIAGLQQGEDAVRVKLVEDKAACKPARDAAQAAPDAPAATCC